MIGAVWRAPAIETPRASAPSSRPTTRAAPARAIQRLGARFVLRARGRRRAGRRRISEAQSEALYTSSALHGGEAAREGGDHTAMVPGRRAPPAARRGSVRGMRQARGGDLERRTAATAPATAGRGLVVNGVQVTGPRTCRRSAGGSQPMFRRQRVNFVSQMHGGIAHARLARAPKAARRARRRDRERRVRSSRSPQTQDARVPTPMHRRHCVRSIRRSFRYGRRGDLLAGA